MCLLLLFLKARKFCCSVELERQEGWRDVCWCVGKVSGEQSEQSGTSGVVVFQFQMHKN